MVFFQVRANGYAAQLAVFPETLEDIPPADWPFLYDLERILTDRVEAYVAANRKI